ncbi:MAG: tRNA (guanosine(46)-N7)-methyltransferase TrmB [Gammaproteobacteria bacterium]|nr:tRNA (guanosine(46)-N7)-methyltransferase TrmB [Gammaproteobacteria bacterium]
MVEPESPLRHIRSFVRREGRITVAQQRALSTLWPRFGITPGAEELDLDLIFGRRAPRILEIGFGMGDSLLACANAHSETDYLGIEVHRPGIGGVLRKLDELNLSNVRIIDGDALVALRMNISDAAFDAIYVFFPDPWPKKRHHKRRLVQPDFMTLMHAKLKPGGLLHFATDWDNYAQHMLDVVNATPQFRNTAGVGQFAASRGERPETKFERRGLALGHDVWDLIVEKAR